MFKRNIGVIIILFVVLIYFITGTVERWMRNQGFQDQWGQFDSQDYYQAEDFPDGFRLDYPASWGVFTYEKGKPQKLF